MCVFVGGNDGRRTCPFAWFWYSEWSWLRGKETRLPNTGGDCSLGHIGIPSHLVEVNHRQLADQVSLSNVAPGFEAEWLSRSSCTGWGNLAVFAARYWNEKRLALECSRNKVFKSYQIIFETPWDSAWNVICAYQCLTVQRVMSRLAEPQTSHRILKFPWFFLRPSRTSLIFCCRW